VKSIENSISNETEAITTEVMETTPDTTSGIIENTDLGDMETTEVDGGMPKTNGINLIKNPGAEELLTYWKSVFEGSYGCEIEASTEETFNGNCAFFFNAHAYEVGHIKQKIKLKKGKRYLLSSYLKYNDSMNPYAVFRFPLKFAEGTKNLDIEFKCTSEWRLCTKQIFIPESILNEEIEFTFGIFSHFASVYVDDIKLEEIIE